MVEYTKVNVKLSNTQIKKLKDAVKNNTGTTLRISLRTFNGNDLPHELLLTTRQKTKIRNAFNNNTFTDIKLFKKQIDKLIQSCGFLGKIFSPLLKTGLPLIENIIKPLAKSVLILLGLTAAAWAADAGIHKKILGSRNTTLNISNEEKNDIIKVLQTLEDFNVFLKGVTKTTEKETKDEKGGFLSMLLGTLGASLLGNLLTGEGFVSAVSGNNKGKVVVRAGHGNQLKNKVDF